MRTNRLTSTLLALTLGLALAACNGATTPGPQPDDGQHGTVLRSSQQRNTSPDVPPADLQALVAGNTDFAFDMYHQIRQTKPGNLFFSPQSISQALAMTWGGARGANATQMAEVLSFTLPADRLHPAFNALDLTLASRGQGAQGMDGGGFRLRLVNAIWGQQGYGFLESFLDLLAVNYDAGLRLLDFCADPDAGRLVINDWVEQQTEGKIKDLLEPGTVTGDTRLVLTNAIYFNAQWKEVFPTENSVDGPFTLLDGSSVTVPTMALYAEYGHAAGAGYQAVELAYDGDELAMLIVLPDAGRFAEVETSLDGAAVSALAASLEQKNLTLTMPKWTVDTKLSVKEQLEGLGMTDAFAPPTADFTGINGGVEPLWISDVIHQAHVLVNEYGTEAAAATAVIMVGGAMPDPLRVDALRPFIYVIRDRPTGTILFVGRILNPAA
ncbi:MAG: serpin family protein [Deltaproteobacteria bacterium]|nr:serpin family protein [Deltaproteobacteria bacterium]